MKDFFKSFWGTLAAIVVACVLFFVLSIAIFAGIMSSFSSSAVVLKPNSVLTLSFDENIVDSPVTDPMSLIMSFNGVSKNLTMLQVVTALEQAKSDDNIKGIYLRFGGAGNVQGTAQLEELRTALIDFKSSGKFIVSYNNSYVQGQYWLASVADKIYLNPEGALDWRGLASNVIFYKGLIDKLNIDVDIIRHGTYKSAVEPYITDRMSPANRLQMEALTGSMWTTLLNDVSAARNIDVEELQSYADNLSLVTAADAAELGFIDEVLYEDQVNVIIADLIAGAEKEAEEGKETEEADDDKDREKFESISLGDYVSLAAVESKKISKNKVAIIYADGQIVDGKGGADITPGAMMEKLQEARKDKNVKAVVLRINSPGGSALASEEIWREVTLLREQKPVIVSMANYAASGGYYIASPADVILSDRTTLTGSIGVFGVVPSVGNALESKLGITVDVAKTNPHADMANGMRPLSEAEKAYMTKSVENVYTTFVNHVADGRNMTFEAVDKIGEGRVWSGADALGIGLVDGMGGLKDAIALAADRADVIDDFRVVEILPEADSFTALMQQFSAAVKVALGREVADEALTYYNTVRKMVESSGVQAMMPYFVEIEQ